MRDTSYSARNSEHGMSGTKGDARSPGRRVRAATPKAANRRLRALVAAWRHFKEAVAGQLPQLQAEPVPVPVRVKAGSRRSGPDARA